tara:strand:+ start:312 stop:593 length:282 start_codon:yes stop_codon:yes gene_type:complete
MPDSDYSRMLVELAKKTPWKELSSSSDLNPALQDVLKELRRIKLNLEGENQTIKTRGLSGPTSRMPMIDRYNPDRVKTERSKFSPVHGLFQET